MNVRKVLIRIALFGLALCALACSDDQIGGGPTGSRGGNCASGNRAPHIDPVGPQAVAEGAQLRVVFTVSDPDGDTMFLDAESLPEGAAFDAVRGVFTWTPGFDLVSAAEGSLVVPDVEVTVDDDCASDSTAFGITVTNVNRAPFFLSSNAAPLSEIAANVEPDAEERVSFQVVDPDGDQPVLVLESSPAYARLEQTTLVLTPTQADGGRVDEFTIAADDGADVSRLPVSVVVGNVQAELPLPQGLEQSHVGGPIEVGGSAYGGLFSFSASPHSFEFDDLRFQVEVAALGTPYEEGSRATSEPLPAGVEPLVELTLNGGASYRWRARYLSDDFGPGPYASFGGNVDNEPDLTVNIVPETSLDVVPHDPSPIDVVFEFSSSNVSDFECQLDSGSYADCQSPRALNGLTAGNHTFRVRGVTRAGVPDPSPEEYTWEVIALGPPDTFFTVSPAASVGCTARFEFASDQGAATFECRLGTGSDPTWGPCSSPKDYVGLTTGNYAFEVRAINVVALKDQTPARHTFTSNCSE